MRFRDNQIVQNASMALWTLRANKAQSSLSILGVTIGVWTVMAIASIISGIDTAVTREVENLGADSIFINKFDSGIRFEKLSTKELSRKDLTAEDSQAVASLPSIRISVPFLNVTNDFFGRKIMVVANGRSSAAVRLEGTEADYIDANLEVISDGRFFTKFENDTNQEVCVMHSGAASNFFPFTSAVGQMVKIDGREFRVVGVFEKRESLFASSDGSDDFSNSIMMPLNVARKLKPHATDMTILAVAHPGELDSAQDQIVDLLRIRRRVDFDQPNDFGISTSQSIIASFRSITFGVAVLMIVMSSIGLLVGGIGVMNVMLVSVTDRTSEIGMRKAIGARRSDVRWQFLVEAMTITGIGGVLGLLLGWMTTFVIGQFVFSRIPWWAPLLGFMTSVGIGLVFGLWPASRAASLDPVEAIRRD